MKQMKTVLITGANKSIGFETARQFLQQGFKVYLGSRDAAKGEDAVATLKAEGLAHADSRVIDVNNASSIQAARQQLGQKIKALDVLINNAGVSGPIMTGPLKTGMDEFREVFE